METSTIFIILLGITVVGLIITIIVNKSNAEAAVAKLELNLQANVRAKNTLETELDRCLSNLTKANLEVEKYTTLLAKREEGLLKQLRFRMPTGEIANNVKVKTVREGNRIIRVRATIRKYVGGKSGEVEVKPFLHIE